MSNYCPTCKTVYDYRFCHKCHHSGWFHPKDIDGNTDYSRAIPCACRLKWEEKVKSNPNWRPSQDETSELPYL